MVFPRYIADQEDPEIAAERELAALEMDTNAAVIRAKEASRVKEAAAVAAAVNGRRSTEADEQRPIDRSSLSSISNSSASIDTVASSTAPAGNSKAKESKAERKKRSRGVSGCSVKKDGGKFDMGFEDLEDYDYEDDEDDFDAAAREAHFCRMRKHQETTVQVYQRSAAPDHTEETNVEKEEEEEEEEVEVEKKEEDEEEDERRAEWVELIHLAVINQPAEMTEHFEALFEEKKSESAILFCLVNSLRVLYETKLDTELVSDPLYEYKLSEMIRKIMDEGVISHYTIRNYLDRRLGAANRGRHIDHVRELFMWTMLQLNDFVNDGRLKIYIRVPRDGAKLAKEMLVEHNLNEVAHLLQEIKPWFHADFVYEIFSRSIGYMSINQVYYAVQSCFELFDAVMLSKESIRIGIRRLVREVPELETDLPCAASLVHMVFSYAMSMLPVTAEDKEDLSPPKHMLYGSLAGDGRLMVCDPPADLKVLTADNFIYLDE